MLRGFTVKGESLWQVDNVSSQIPVIHNTSANGDNDYVNRIDIGINIYRHLFSPNHGIRAAGKIPENDHG